MHMLNSMRIKASTNAVMAALVKGQALPVEVHDMEYLGEKLRCIFGPIIDANPAARAALKKALFGNEPDVAQVWDAAEEGAA